MSESETPPPEVVALARAEGFSGELLSSAEFRRATGLGRDALSKRVARARVSGRGVVFFEDPRRRSSGQTRGLWFPAEQLRDPPTHFGSPPLGVPDRRVEHELELELQRQRGITEAQAQRIAVLEADRAALRDAVARLTEALVRATGGADA